MLTFEDVTDLLVGVHVLLEKGLDLQFVVGQLVGGDSDDVLDDEARTLKGSQ